MIYTRSQSVLWILKSEIVQKLTAAITRDVPVYAHFGVTHRCNLTCKMCGIWRYGNAKEELRIRKYNRLPNE